MCLPAAAARWMRSACVSVDEPISTASMLRSAKIWSTVTTAERSGQLGGRFSDRVGDARQCHAGVAGGVCCMNLADATSADDCQTDGHGVSPIGFRYLRKSGS
jgi:hypothetical protein